MTQSLGLNNNTRYIITTHTYSFLECLDVVKLYLSDYIEELSPKEIEELTISEVLVQAQALGCGRLNSFTSCKLTLGIDHGIYNAFIDHFIVSANICWKRVNIPPKHYVASILPYAGYNLIINMARWSKNDS